jgi:invasion protein IalB
MAGNGRNGRRVLRRVVAGSVGVLLALTATAMAQAPTVPGAAAAAGANQPPPAPQWIKICSPDPNTKKNLCLIQEEIYADTGQFIASATMRTVQDDPKMQFIIGVPPGMLIQPGLQVQVDSGKQTPLAYSICFPNTCFADADATADLLKSIRAGKQLTIAAINSSGQTASFSISLSGFSKAYDGPGIDPNTPSGQATLDALNASLQAHAQAARQTLIDQQQQRPQ